MIDGAYFIDRDPKYFPCVLNYLRNGQLVIDSDISLQAIKYEARYFGLVNLEEELKERIGLEEDRGRLTCCTINKMLASRKTNSVQEALHAGVQFNVDKEMVVT